MSSSILESTSRSESVEIPVKIFLVFAFFTFSVGRFTAEPTILPSSKLLMLLFSNSMEDFSYS